MPKNGLRIAKSQGMEGYTGNTNNFPIALTNTSPMFMGDPVVLAAGAVQAATVAANAIAGVFMGWEDHGVEVDYGQRGQPFNRMWTATDGARAKKPFAKIATPPHGMFWIYGEPGVDFQPDTSIGFAHPFTLNAGDAMYGDSRVTLAAPGAGPVIVHRIVEQPGNVWGTAGPLLEVSVNLQTLTFADVA